MGRERKILLLADFGKLGCHKSYGEVIRFLYFLPWVGLIWYGSRPQDRRKLLRGMISSFNIGFQNIVYVGAGYSDIDALLEVRSNNGLAVILNGEDAVLNVASLALVADTAWPIALLSAVFAEWGGLGVWEMVKLNPSPRNISHLMLPAEWTEILTAGLKESKFSFYNTLCPQSFEKAIRHIF